MTEVYRVAVSQFFRICMIYGPLTTFACHRVLKSGYLTTQSPQVLSSTQAWGSPAVFKQLTPDIEA